MKWKAITHVCVCALLLGVCARATAQVPSQSRVRVTAEAAITGYRSYRQGDRLYVLILSPVSPATDTSLLAGGFEDLQVTQQGADLAISFRLDPSKSVAVQQKANVIEIAIQGSSPQRLPFTEVTRSETPRADMVRSDARADMVRSDLGGDVQARSEAETSPSAPRSETNGGSSDAPVRPSDAAVAPAPIATIDELQKANKLSILNDEDLAVPESPAFTVLGLTPQTVVRPATPKEFVSSLLNGVDEHGNLQSGLAFDAIPFLVFGGDGVSLYKYNHNYMMRLLSRTQTSFATTKGTGDADKSIRLALGLHMTLWDRGDPRADTELFKCYDQVERQINSDVVEFMTTKGVKDPGFPAFFAEQKTRFKTVTDECDVKARERNWKSSGLVIGAAPSWISPTGTTDKFRWNGGGVWASLAYGFEGVGGLERNSQLIFHARFRSNEQVPDPDNPGNFLTQKSTFFGTRLRLGNPDTNVSFEGVYIRLKRPGELRDNSYRYLVGLERRIAQNIWFQLSLGSDAGRRDSNNKAFIKGTFNWGFVKKEDAVSPAVSAMPPP